MTGNSHQENTSSSLLLQQYDKKKRNKSVEKLKQEFLPIAKQYIPYQDCYNSFMETIFADFLSFIQPSKVKSIENNTVALTEKISMFCKRKRSILCKVAEQESLQKLPKQKALLKTLIGRKENPLPTKKAKHTRKLLEKKKSIGQLIHWTSVEHRVSVSMEMGDVVLSPTHTGEERTFLAINPIVWYKEFAASQNILEEEAFSRISKSNALLTNPTYRKAASKKQIQKRMQILFPQQEDKWSAVYKKYKFTLQQKLNTLFKWYAPTPTHQQDLIHFLPNLSQHAYKIAIGIAYRLPTSMYISAVMIKHIYDEPRALQFLHKVDIRDWEERIFLLVPEEESQIGRDSEILFRALDEMESRATKILRVKNAN